MDNKFRATMKGLQCGNNMFPHCLKFYLEPSELVMMLEFCEDANDDRNKDIIYKRAADIGWSQRNFIRVFGRLREMGLVLLKRVQRGSEVRLNYDAIKKLDGIMYEFGRLQYRLRHYTKDRDILSIRRRELLQYDRIERKRLAENFTQATFGLIESDELS